MDIDFKNEVIEKFSESDFQSIDSYIEKILEDTDDTSETINDWECSVSIEKHDSLNHSYYFEFKKDDGHICVSYYTGINVGCEMQEYSLDGDSELEKPKSISVFSHLVVDWLPYLIQHQKSEKSELCPNLVRKVENMFTQHKAKIEDLISKQNYDNYVTGGGTVSTNDFYRNEFNKIRKMGLYWDVIYKDEVVERNFI